MARATGRPVREVGADPWALTVWTLAQLLDAERIDDTVDKLRDVQRANLAVLSHHDPGKLEDVDRELRAAAGMLPSNEQIIAGVQDVITAMQRIDAAGLGGMSAPAQEASGE